LHPARRRLILVVRSLKSIFYILFSLILIGCNSSQSTLLSARIEEQDKDCKKANGQLRQVTTFVYVCTWPSTDKGKACTDSKDCEGICEAPDSAYEVIGEEGKDSSGSTLQPIKVLRAHVGDSLVGVCSSIRTEGKSINCSEFVSNGKLTLSQCFN
jgi:hypothetical protein